MSHHVFNITYLYDLMRLGVVVVVAPSTHSLQVDLVSHTTNKPQPLHSTLHILFFQTSKLKKREKNLPFNKLCYITCLNYLLCELDLTSSATLIPSSVYHMGVGHSYHSSRIDYLNKIFILMFSLIVASAPFCGGRASIL